MVRLKDDANILPLELFTVGEKGVLKDERIGFVLRRSDQGLPRRPKARDIL